jgi:uncharacterized oligopeptide transporter (OPT) family protein
MALMAKGIVGGQMAWPLVLVGMLMAVGLILIGSMSPMLIAVGMYLPFTSTAAIFVGGIIRYLMDRALEKRGASKEARIAAENTGVLISSGLIAGESLMAVILAFIVLGRTMKGQEPSALLHIANNPWLGMLIFLVLGWILVRYPVRAAEKQ